MSISSRFAFLTITGGKNSPQKHIASAKITLLLMGIMIDKLNHNHLQVNMTEIMTRGVSILEAYQDHKYLQHSQTLIFTPNSGRAFLRPYLPFDTILKLVIIKNIPIDESLKTPKRNFEHFITFIRILRPFIMAP